MSLHPAAQSRPITWCVGDIVLSVTFDGDLLNYRVFLEEIKDICGLLYPVTDWLDYCSLAGLLLVYDWLKLPFPIGLICHLQYWTRAVPLLDSD